MGAKKAAAAFSLLVIGALGVVFIPQVVADSAASDAVWQEPVVAPVERGTLTSEVRLSGQLTYGEAQPLPFVEGMITVLPTTGAIIGHGAQVFEADGIPVVLFQGERPFWRDLTVESARGEDVRQLEENLSVLGFLTAREPGDRFDWRTREAVRQWQRDLGAEVTGEFSPAMVVVTQAPSIRIDQVTARLGDAGVSPATASETSLHVTALLTEAQARELLPGGAVTVALRDGAQLGATIAAIDPGGQPTDDGMTLPSALILPNAGALPVAARPGSVSVTVHDDAEQPVTLVVPVTALLATAQGGYAVEVWDGQVARRVEVQIGLVADARAQVIGGELAEGDLVVLAR
ncbi:MAG: peptidoglycan-binding protein [Promicromonosporaceae bacterium]|nr:peptidoglycan-binding protein [Promicromonosporaceae bacterium]